jgi:DNA-binding IclR family transcriptional regulator
MVRIRAAESGLVQSVGRALDILELLAAESDGAGVSEIARALELKIPTAHNLLRTLRARGYAAKDPAGRYRLGHGCARLGRAYLRDLRVPRAAQPVMDELSERLNESVVLGMMTGGEIAFVARASGTRMLAVNFEPKVVKLGYTSACGRVILAHLPPRQFEAYMASHPLRRGVCEDLAGRRDLDRVLERARREGHLEYWREGGTVLAIAAPIRDFSGEVVAAVGVGMPGVRFKKNQRGHIVRNVKEAAERISAGLGHESKSTAAGAVR